jgi:hypothetical protein
MTSGFLCPVYFLSDSTGITAETRGQHLAEQIGITLHAAAGQYRLSLVLGP